MERSIRQTLINTIKMLPHNDKSIELMKDMLIGYIKRDEDCGPVNTCLGESKIKYTGIERNFQEDMINDMDSLY